MIRRTKWVFLFSWWGYRESSKCTALDRHFLFVFYSESIVPSFPRSTTASEWGLVFRVHIHPRYPLLIRFWFFSDVSVHTIEALGSAVERKENSPRREKESISLLLFYSSVASPLCIDLSSLHVIVLSLSPLHYSSCRYSLLSLLFSSYCLLHVFLPDNATSSFFLLTTSRLFVWCFYTSIWHELLMGHIHLSIYSPTRISS